MLWRRPRGASSVAGTRGTAPSAPARTAAAAIRALPRAAGGGAYQLSSRSSAASTSSTSSAPATYARPSPSWPGARSTWPRATGERSWKVGPPPPLVAGSSGGGWGPRRGWWRAARCRPTARAGTAARGGPRRGWRAAARCSCRELRRLARAAHADHVPCEPHPLQGPHHRRRHVGLPPAAPVRGGGRERVVVVVPRLPERQHRKPPEVARLVAGVEAPAAEEVAQRVDRVRHMVQDEHAHAAAPQQAGQAVLERPAEGPAEHERHAQ